MNWVNTHFQVYFGPELLMNLARLCFNNVCEMSKHFMINVNTTPAIKHTKELNISRPRVRTKDMWQMIF